jgi:hypothetical protein
VLSQKFSRLDHPGRAMDKKWTMSKTCFSKDAEEEVPRISKSW